MGLVLLDLHKAFDMVNHDILLQKRTIYRLSDSAIHWFKSYLSDRSQMVQYQQTMSEPMRVSSGVPQGSILGTLLFIIFMNDLLLEVENYNLDMYADDSTLEVSAKTVDQLEHKLASNMVKVEHWCFLNKMMLNINKRKTTMLITTYQKLPKMLVKILASQ